jgi:ElaB/YqjD/DUF883 family membrane-anchored ribosome-binding protein
LASGLRDKAHEVDEARHHLYDKASAAKQRLASGVEGGRHRVASEIQDHPMRTLLWAFGAGAVVGLMLGRRPRR